MKEVSLDDALFWSYRIVTKLDELMRYSDALEASIQASRVQNEGLLQQVLRGALEPGNGE